MASKIENKAKKEGGSPAAASRSAKAAKPEWLPVIPVRDTVVFPRVGAPIVVRRGRSVRSLEQAMASDRRMVFVAQRQPEASDPTTEEIYAVGTLVKINEAIRQPDRSFRVAADGLSRVRLLELREGDNGLEAAVVVLPEPSSSGKSDRLEALTYSTINQFRRVVGMGANVPFDVLLAVMNLTDPWFLGDLVAAHLDLQVSEKQDVLEAENALDKLELVNRAMGRQIQLLQMASHIEAETGKELDKMQREAFLREQLRSIERALEEMGARPEDDDLLVSLEKAGMPAEVRAKALKEYARLKQSSGYGPESTYLRAWLECLAGLPWQERPRPEINLKAAKSRLDADHFGLKKAKDRIMEYLAVQKLTGGNRGPILCFVGPPGTGKTSIGKSIAEAVGRPFHRISLGGVRDESEIRGHRRTYVGALPGRIIQGIQQAKSRAPVFMLDELDKTGSDWRGDPASALLEALDPEQNFNFSDHYLEVPFDLSEVMFIATANVIENVPPALRDRLEVIRFPGYTEEDKLRIAQDHLIPKVLENNGLAKAGVSFAPAAIQKIIRSYTMEAGVRNLERELNSVSRKLARRLAEAKPGGKGNVKKKPARQRIGQRQVTEQLGPEKILPSRMDRQDRVGRITGLAWTGTGGDILSIEVAAMPGKGGQLLLTGHLGQVMKESAQAALTWVRSSAKKLNLELPDRQTDIHLHVPAGAIPKDGPSAGVAMAVALVSLFGNRKIKRQVGVTGEITLRGDVLEIGGLREKVLAARRAGLKTVVMPEQNRRDLADLPPNAHKDLDFIPVKRVEEALEAILVPEKKRKQAKKIAKGSSRAKLAKRR